MLERVARAIGLAEHFPDSDAPVMVGMKTMPVWQSRLSVARAAMDAMKYADGTDESILLAVSKVEQVEAVSLIGAWDALIDLHLGTPLPASAPTDATSRSGQHDAPGILGGE